ncbi:glycosyltransferase family 4 protein [Halomicrobium sp. IBSBa]|uniref:glycosyltransferase family 4 protein n=1 Tax=Halomicrobium sp. IBSBa TaxID=2778916 RepID=UPI001ABEF463|nr:glycosyltransferase family 4 protein [Halomicrobium sp. IBSBa]MBO4248906.1 glycosyltransferase family 4 protein [Halomicrobium sp. IBSBa]
MNDTQEPRSIFYLTQYFPPETGAAATRVQELTERWGDAGHDVTVVTSAPDYPEGELFDGYNNDWLAVEQRNGVRVVMTKTLPTSNTRTVRRMLKFVWFMFAATAACLWLDEDPDMVIATSPQPLLGVSAIITGWLRSSSTVFEIRDLWPESIEEVGDFDNRLAVWLLDRLVSWIYAHVDRIVIVSQAFERPLLNAGVGREDLWYHPNGVDLEFFDDHGDGSEIDETVQAVFDDRFVVSYVGTVGRSHGLEVVLDAADRLRDLPIDFVVVGYGSELERLEQAAASRGLDSVTFVGRRPKHEVPTLLHLSDVSLVHLRDEELFRTVIPSKMFESMAARLPIVLGVEGEAARILDQANAGVQVKPENPVALADAVRQLYEQADLRERFGSNGRQFVGREFAWDTIAADYLTNIETITSDNGQS